MKESGIKKRTTITNHLEYLTSIGFISIISPSDGYKSNRYIINFEVIHNGASNPGLLVTHGYQTSNPGLPTSNPRLPVLVTQGYPNRNIKAPKEKDKRKRGVITPEKQQQNGELTCLVKEWAPGNPDYDRFHEDKG